MEFHTFNVNTFCTLSYRKRENKWENEKNLKNSDQGERQDNFMISCSVVV